LKEISQNLDQIAKKKDMGVLEYRAMLLKANRMGTKLQEQRKVWLSCLKAKYHHR